MIRVIYGGLMLLIFVLTTESSCPVKTTNINVKSGLRQLNLAFLELKTSSSFNCAKQCLLRSICHSLNYNRETRLCELNIEPLESSNNLTPYAYFSHIPAQSLYSLTSTKLAGPCRNHTCSDFTVCVPNGDVFSCLLNVDPKKRCSPSPPTIPYASVDSSNNEAGDIAVYTCNTAYLSGSPNISCRANGQWTVATLQCEIVCLGEPPYIPNTVANYSSNLLQSEAVYSCTLGFLYRSGSTIAICQNDGYWSTDVTIVCTVPAICSASNLPNIFNADRNYTTVTEGSLATYECTDTYISSGNLSVKCQANGQWSTPALMCLPTQCVSQAPSGRYYYQGTLSVSTTGKTCKRFDDAKSVYDKISFFPYDATMDDVANNCRATSDGDIFKPWCYVKFTTVFGLTIRDWEFCDIPTC